MSTFTIKNPAAPATEAQVKFYATMAAKVQSAVLGTDYDTALAAAAIVGAQMTKGAISKAIETLKVDAKAIPAAPATEVAPGYYAKGDTVYVVVISKSSGNPYAKKWTVEPGVTKASWEYAPGAVKTLAGMTPMTLDEAKKWGHMHGHCIKCGALLTDPKSVEAGIGPICAKAF